MSRPDDGSAAFVDLMTSLAVIFILLVVCLINTKDLSPAKLAACPPTCSPAEKERQLAQQKAEDMRDNILKQLCAALQHDGLDVEADPKDKQTLTVIIRQHQLYFPTSKFSLSRAGKKTVEKVFAKIEPIVCRQFDKCIDWVIVEGHTDVEGDKTPRGQDINIDLSSRRATSVVHHALWSLRKDGNDLGCIRSLLSPRGMGSAHPRSNSRNPLLRQDRRVEVKVHVMATLPKIVDTLDNLSEAVDALRQPH